MERRQALALLVVLLMPALAGCNVKDWYNQNGTVRIELLVLPEGVSAINQFRSLTVAIYGITLRQLDAEPKHFAYEPEPLVVDLVKILEDGGRLPIAEYKTNLRASERVAVRVMTVEAVMKDGQNLEICRLNQPVERWPCFYQPDNAALSFEGRAFAPPRGGEAVVGFPVAVYFATRGPAQQYYLAADTTQITIDMKR